jgi:hypothetical protein
MNLEKIGIAFSASLLAMSLSGGIAFGAATDPSQGSGVSGSGMSSVGSSPGVSADSPPELNSAQQRVDMSRGKLDQARQQLSAAKAMLKAAEAEFKAARADQEALSLRSQARKLADASGLQETVSTGQRLYPANMAPGGVPATAAPNANLSATGMTVPGGAPAPVNPVGVDTPDYSGQGSSPAPAAGLLGAPVPNQ